MSHALTLAAGVLLGAVLARIGPGETAWFFLLIPAGLCIGGAVALHMEGKP